MNSGARATSRLGFANLDWYELRLRELDGGECAYEKRLVRAYQQVVAAGREHVSRDDADRGPAR